MEVQGCKDVVVRILSLASQLPPTRRTILSILSLLLHLLDFLASYTMMAKLFSQKLFRSGADWDAVI